MTNILAAIVITLVTNVSERFPTHMETLPPPPGCEFDCVYRCHEVPDINPERKWIKTEVRRITKLHFDWESTPRDVEVKNELVSAIEVEFHLKREESWILATGTNVFIVPAGASFLTNFTAGAGYFH